MIICGGLDIDVLNTGGRYDPSTDNWTPTIITNAPDARVSHTAVWTGGEMIVWGGYFFDAIFRDQYLNTGGKYNPLANSWTAVSTADAPDGRAYHTVVWTGSEMVAWGGYDGSGYVNTGGIYNPGSNTWTATSTVNAPDGRQLHTAVWTGTEMIVWGGATDSNTFNTGGRYNPVSDTWTFTSDNNAPTARSGHIAVWTGNEMIVWGGFSSFVFVSKYWRKIQSAVGYLGGHQHFERARWSRVAYWSVDRQ